MVCLMFCVIASVAFCGVINVGTEQLLTLSQLAKRLPRHRNDRPVHPSTCHRWRSPGVRGVRLECVRIGGSGTRLGNHSKGFAISLLARLRTRRLALRARLRTRLKAAITRIESSKICATGRRERASRSR